ncbi:MAG: ribonuclease HII [Kiritimatiellae bacterium]|nr:ribonuclease HII [Kiritimatiellia bacterium]
MLEYESEAMRRGAKTVVGIDEAGRGPLAGPVYAAAVHLPLDAARAALEGGWAQVNDSKKLSPRKREILAAAIKSTPGCVWAVACATPAEIDSLNILRATHLAMRRAVKALGLGEGVFALVDGLPVEGLPCPSRAIVKGDSKSLLVAAASILAKTARDADCARMEREHPGYGFAKHKGYPTREHLAALAALGPCSEHRKSFSPVKEAAAHGKA